MSRVSDDESSLAHCSLWSVDVLLKQTEFPFSLFHADVRTIHVAPFWVWCTSVLDAVSFLVTLGSDALFVKPCIVVSLLFSRALRSAQCQYGIKSLTHVWALVLLRLEFWARRETAPFLGVFCSYVCRAVFVSLACACVVQFCFVNQPTRPGCCPFHSLRSLTHEHESAIEPSIALV